MLEQNKARKWIRRGRNVYIRFVYYNLARDAHISKLCNYTPCITTLTLHDHSFVVSVRTLHVLKRTRNERCTVPTPYGELYASLLGLLPYLPETSYWG